VPHSHQASIEALQRVGAGAAAARGDGVRRAGVDGVACGEQQASAAVARLPGELGAQHGSSKRRRLVRPGGQRPVLERRHHAGQRGVRGPRAAARRSAHGANCCARNQPSAWEHAAAQRGALRRRRGAARRMARRRRARSAQRRRRAAARGGAARGGGAARSRAEAGERGGHVGNAAEEDAAKGAGKAGGSAWGENDVATTHT
jgi:hypothetical protein